MINVIVWLLCGTVIGAVTTWRRESKTAVLLLAATGMLGGLCGGTLAFVFDTTPVEVFSPLSMVVAILSAVVLVGIAHWLRRGGV